MGVTMNEVRVTGASGAGASIGGGALDATDRYRSAARPPTIRTSPTAPAAIVFDSPFMRAAPTVAPRA